MGCDYIIHPVKYSYKFAYDLRGWLKYIAAFFSVFTGVMMIFWSLDRRKRNTFYCPSCGKTEKLIIEETHRCRLCKIEMKPLDELE